MQTINAIQKFTIYLGLNDKETKQQKISTLEAYKIVSGMISRLFDGGTIFEADGIYKHESGSIVIEKNLENRNTFRGTQRNTTILPAAKRCI